MSRKRLCSNALSRKLREPDKRRLRDDVGFCCPIPGCSSPYLEWHHFDPPWKVKHHHDPARMIALCRDHHPEADAGAFKVEQLHAYKATAKQRAGEVQAK